MATFPRPLCALRVMCGEHDFAPVQSSSRDPVRAKFADSRAAAIASPRSLSRSSSVAKDRDEAGGDRN